MPATPSHTRAPHKRYALYVLCAILLLSIFMGAVESGAKEVVLTTGERFTSTKIWQTSDKIKFNMHGLVVTVDKSDVAAIIEDDGSQQPMATAAPQYAPTPAPVHTPAPAVKKTPAPLSPAKKQQKPAPRTAHKTAPSTKQPPPPGPGKIDGVGHGGLSWLMTPADITGLAYIGKDPDDESIDQYWRPSEKMALGEARLDGIVYGFWQNKLYSIMMWVDGPPGYERLRQSVFQHYGQGRKSTKVKDRYMWISRQSDRMLEFDHHRNTGFFWMRSRQLDARMKAQLPKG